MTVIALIGLSRSGKDTSADCLIDRVNRSNSVRAVKMAFATPVKDMAGRYFEVNQYDAEMKKDAGIFANGQSYRSLVKDIAELFKNYDPDIWVKTLDSSIDRYKDHGYDPDEDWFVVTDCRFENELEHLKRKGAIVIDIFRDDLYIKEKKIVKILGVNWFSRTIVWLINKKLAHISEWSYWKIREKANYQVDNTDLEAGEKRIKTIVSEINLHLENSIAFTQ